MATIFEPFEDRVIRDRAAYEVDMKHRKEEWTQATQKARKALDAEMDALKAQAAQGTAEMERLNNEMDAKIDPLREQLKQANDRQKAKIEKHIAEVKAKYETQKAELDKLIADAKAEQEARQAEIEKRAIEIKAEHEARKAKLAQANTLIKEALRS